MQTRTRLVGFVIFVFLTLSLLFPHFSYAGSTYDGEYEGNAEIKKLQATIYNTITVSNSQFRTSLKKTITWSGGGTEIPISLAFDIDGTIGDEGKITGKVFGTGEVGIGESSAGWSIKGEVSGTVSESELSFSFRAEPTVVRCPQMGAANVTCSAEPFDVTALYSRLESGATDVIETTAKISIAKIMGDVQVVNPDTQNSYGIFEMSKDFILGALGRKSAKKIGAWGEGKKEMELPINSRIQTGVGRAVIEFKDGTKFVVREHSSFRIVSGGFELERGGFYMTFVKQKNGQIILKDKRSLVGIRGTRLSMEIGETETVLTVYEGLVEVSLQKGGKKMEVSGGKQVMLSANNIESQEKIDVSAMEKEWQDAAVKNRTTGAIPPLIIGFLLGMLFLLGVVVAFKQTALGIILIILSVGVGGFLWGSGQKQETKESSLSISPTTTLSPTPLPSATPTPSSTDTTVSWKTYSNDALGFSLKHPEDVKSEVYNDGTFMLSLWGKTQTEDTEFFDGISISITRHPLSGRTLAEVVEENRKGSEEIAGETVVTAKSSSLGGVEGLTYTAMGSDYYFLPVEKDAYLELLNLSKDPGKVGYTKTAEQILSSFSIIKE